MSNSNIKPFINGTSDALNNLAQALIHHGVAADDKVINLMNNMQDDICRLDQRIYELEE